MSSTPISPYVLFYPADHMSIWGTVQAIRLMRPTLIELISSSHHICPTPSIARPLLIHDPPHELQTAPSLVHTFDLSANLIQRNFAQPCIPDRDDLVTFFFLLVSLVAWLVHVLETFFLG